MSRLCGGSIPKAANIRFPSASLLSALRSDVVDTPNQHGKFYGKLGASSGPIQLGSRLRLRYL
jgi:hypothetical protein